MNAWERIWAQMTLVERREGVEAFLESAEAVPASRASALRLLATVTGSRPEVVARWPIEERALRLSRVRQPHPDNLRAFVEGFHMTRRAALLDRFLSLLQIPNSNGVVDARTLPDALPTGALADAIVVIRREFPPEHVLLYLDALEAAGSVTWGNLSEARRLAASRGAPPPAAAGADPVSDAPSPPPPLPPPPPPAPPAPLQTRLGPLAASSAEPFYGGLERMTALDDLLMDACVAVASGIEGARPLDRLRAAVDEVVRLNAARHRTYYHLGFLDVLQGKTPDPDFPQASERHRGWYLCGAIHALSRRGDAAGIAALFDRHPADGKRLLGDRHDACGESVALLYDALSSQGRRAEFLRDVTPSAAGQGGTAFLDRILSDAAEALAASRPADVLPLVRLVSDAVETLTRRNRAPPPRVDESARLLRAAALRLEGSFAPAREVLSGLLGSSDPATAARAHGDLGLVTCGFRSVADVCLPASAGELATTARVLSAGAEHFARAATDANPARAEADFVLGVLRFAEGSGALPPLDRVVAARGSLGAGTPLEVVAPCARLYLGVALAESLDLSRAAEAVEHLVSGAREAPAAAHAWLLSRALTALAATRPDLASSAAHALLLAVGDRLLDAALDAGLLPSQPALREMLAARVEDAHRPGLARAADAEALLRDSLLASDVPLAERALDALEGLADAPEGRRRLLAILEVRSRHDPAWSAEEALYARVRLLEAEARYEEAARLLSAAGHEVLSKDPERGLPTVDDFLDRIDGYGIPRPDAALDARCAALRKASTPPAPPAVEPKGRVYFVGGNEVQARYEEWLRAEARRRWPHVTLDFDFTGWSGNWGRTLAATEGRIEAADSVVVMQFIRTMLGRAVRSLCGRHGRPWVACTGHGRQSLLSAIERAVAVLPSRNS